MSTKAQTETTEKHIKKLLARWAPLEYKRQELIAVRDAAVKREREKFDKACAPFNTKANDKLTPLDEEIKPIRDEVERLLLAAVDKDNVALLPLVESRDARAVVDTRAQRTIDPRAFYEFVTEADRKAPRFWECFDVLIGKTAKFLGEKIEQLAKPDRKHRVTIELK
jgi:hypothetical protein